MSLAEMQVNRNLMFTVDQLELIRRLRNSGLTKEQVLSAFDSFECLDGEVSKSVDIPMTLHALQMQALQCLVLAAPSAVAIGNGTSDNRTRQQLTQLQSRQQRQRISMQQLLPRLPVGHGRTVPDGQEPEHPQHDEGIAVKSASDSGTASDSSSSSNEDAISNSGGRLPDGFEEHEVSSEEMREFFGQGEVACLEEIKDFIQKHNIKQQQIAALAGVSQPYVSRYLRGDFNGMSDRSCCAIKKWYLTYRTNPMAIGVAASSALMMANSSGTPPVPMVKKPMSQASIDLSGLVSSVPAAEMETCGSQRRERFVFRSNQLQILERSFADDNYPSYDRREDLAKTCNVSTQDLVGRELTDKERISIQIVSNWFANRRKELKKLYKEEGLDPSQVPLRSRGRPSHSFLDLPLVQSILNHRGAVSMTTAGSDSSSLSNGTARPDAATTADNTAELQSSQVEVNAVNQGAVSFPATIVKTEIEEVTDSA